MDINTNNTTNGTVSMETIDPRYDIERVLYCIGAFITLMLTSLQLSLHWRQVYAGSPRPWPLNYLRPSIAKILPTHVHMAVTAPTARSLNKPTVIAPIPQTFIIPLLKSELHVINWVMSVCLAVLSPDPTLVYDILPLVVLPYSRRTISAMLFLAWTRWIIRILDVRYKDIGRNVPPLLPRLLRMFSVVLFVSCILFPSLAWITGWDLWMGCLIMLHIATYIGTIVLSTAVTISFRRTLRAAQHTQRNNAYMYTTDDGSGLMAQPNVVTTPFKQHQQHRHQLLLSNTLVRQLVGLVCVFVIIMAGFFADVVVFMTRVIVHPFDPFHSGPKSEWVFNTTHLGMFIMVLQLVSWAWIPLNPKPKSTPPVVKMVAPVSPL